MINGRIDHVPERTFNYVHPSLEPRWDRLPCECCQGTLKRYFEDGIFTGDSMYAVLRGDLYDAGGRLDNEHWKVLRDTMRFIYNELPANCAFSKENVMAWLDKGGARNDPAFNKWICNECGEERIDDARVEGDMKCGYCAYSGGEMVEAEEY